MHLESLSLRGFKSFERRVTLRFDRRITAVVGPNGSGKSNIADAIRWVLGEQSMQALRSKNLVDLIFAGTDRRSPVNVAEVILTVNNEDGSLPVPYAQVSVTRRVYRAGESEFFINGIPCRLKEIQQLFLDTGVGRRGVSLIGQGEIDALLTATPEQRRGWVEDLAGIARYQLQKQQALAKAESARQELTRLQDVIIEVRSQRDRLHAEAMRARRYRDLLSRLRVGEWQLYLAARHAAEKRVAAAQARLDAAQARLEEALAEHRQHVSELEALRQELAGLREAASCAEHRERQVREELGRLERDESVLAVERRQAAQELRARRQKLRSLRAEAAQRVEARRAARRARSEAAREAAQAQAALREAEAELARVEAAVPQAAGPDLTELRARAGGLREQLASFRAEAGARAQALEERREQLEQAEGRLAALRAALEEARRTLERLGSERARLEAEVEARRKALAQAEDAYRQAEAGLARLEREHERLQARLGSLRQLIAEGQGYASGPRLILQERERFPGLVGSVAELLRIPPELARAAEAALGGAGQYLVTRDEEAVRQAIAWLKAGARGRATFLPLDRLRPSPPLPPEHPARRAAGALGVLAEMAGVREGFEVLLVYFFGRTVVLESLDAALRLQKSPAMPTGGGARLVTIEGDLLLPSGAVTGGAFRHEAGGLIARQSELARLEEAAARAAAALERAGEAAREASAVLRQARTARERAEEGWREAVAAHRAAEQEVGRLSRDEAALEREVAQGRAFLEAEEAQVAGLRARCDALAAELTAVEAELAQAEGDASRQAEALEAARARVEEALRAVGEARLAHQAAAHRFQEACRLLEEQRAAWAAWRQAMDELAGTSAASEAGRAELARRRQALREARRQVEEELARLQSEGRDLAAALQAAEEKLVRQEALAGEAARKIDAAREKHHRAELELVKERSELDHLLNDAPVPPDEVKGQDAEAAAALEPPTASLEALREEVRSLRAGLARLGPVNLAAEEAFQEVEARLRNLEAQRDDLIAARRELAEMVETIDRTSKERFRTAFAALQEAMQDLFQRLFDGGEARLELTAPDDPLHSGVELSVRPPGKRWQPLVALSGGERSLCLVALLFAMQKVRPSAFALLDEVDAALDRRNLIRFVSVLDEFSARTQFVLISHRPETVEVARILYGATLDGDGTSRLVSLKVPEPEEEAHESV